MSRPVTQSTETAPSDLDEQSVSLPRGGTALDTLCLDCVCMCGGQGGVGWEGGGACVCVCVGVRVCA